MLDIQVPVLTARTFSCFPFAPYYESPRWVKGGRVEVVYLQV